MTTDNTEVTSSESSGSSYDPTNAVKGCLSDEHNAAMNANMTYVQEEIGLMGPMALMKDSVYEKISDSATIIDSIDNTCLAESLAENPDGCSSINNGLSSASVDDLTMLKSILQKYRPSLTILVNKIVNLYAAHLEMCDSTSVDKIVILKRIVNKVRDIFNTGDTIDCEYSAYSYDVSGMEESSEELNNMFPFLSKCTTSDQNTGLNIDADYINEKTNVSGPAAMLEDDVRAKIKNMVNVIRDIDDKCIVENDSTGTFSSKSDCEDVKEMLSSVSVDDLNQMEEMVDRYSSVLSTIINKVSSLAMDVTSACAGTDASEKAELIKEITDTVRNIVGNSGYCQVSGMSEESVETVSETVSESVVETTSENIADTVSETVSENVVEVTSESTSVSTSTSTSTSSDESDGGSYTWIIVIIVIALIIGAYFMFGRSSSPAPTMGRPVNIGIHIKYSQLQILNYQHKIDKIIVLPITTDLLK